MDSALAVTIRALFVERANAVTARSISAASRTLTVVSSNFSEGAIAWITANWPIPTLWLWSRRTATLVEPGAISLSSSNHFPLKRYSNSKKPVTCPFGKKEPESYGFDITKADKIFDLLLSDGLIKLKPYHKIPLEDELKNMKYCKWHNATSHDTNECKVFR